MCDAHSTSDKLSIFFEMINLPFRLASFKLHISSWSKSRPVNPKRMPSNLFSSAILYDSIQPVTVYHIFVSRSCSKCFQFIFFASKKIYKTKKSDTPRAQMERLNDNRLLLLLLVECWNLVISEIKNAIIKLSD